MDAEGKPCGCDYSYTCEMHQRVIDRKAREANTYDVLSTLRDALLELATQLKNEKVKESLKGIEEALLALHEGEIERRGSTLK